MNERERILQMLADGRLTVEESARLLDAIGKTPPPPAAIREEGSAAARSDHFLRVRIDAREDGDGGPAKVNINVPLSLARRTLPFLKRCIPDKALHKMEEAGVDPSVFDGIEEVLCSLEDSMLEGRLDIVDVDAGEGDKAVKVSVFIE